MLHSQVVINEVSSATVSTFTDEDGDLEDWIEFYNTSAIAIDMIGYTISRNENGNIKSWTFPSLIIKPYGYLTVFCSEKNRNAYFDHWEVPIYPENVWRYFPGFSEPDPLWRETTFDDSSWQQGIAGIGYGDDDDSTLIAPTASLYMRKDFFVADTSKVSVALFLIDYDDAFVAYLNDVEIARSNIGVYGDHPAYSDLAYQDHEALSYQGGGPDGFFIDKQTLNSALKVGLNNFSLQVHNIDTASSDMSAIPYFLMGVNDTTITYPSFDAGVTLHTNFNLNSSGQILALKDASGNLQDQYTISAMQINNSFGRRLNGTNNWYYFDQPTPNTTNDTSSFYTNYAGKPSFTLSAGFYNGTQIVGLSTGSGVINYTLDGKDPDQNSALYSVPITIDSTRVVRARAYSTNPLELPSEISTNTYFIDETITLPAVSLTSDPINLFDDYYGIYTDANIENGWERPANIEYFDLQGSQGFETPASIAIQGNFSKTWPQRGFAVKTKENYNGSTINYPLFPGKPNVTQYKSFNIRNAGSDWNTCHMRDRFNQKNAQKSTNLDIMDGRPCVLFINGIYWGVYELREKQDKHYIANNNGVDADKIDFLQFDGDIIEGSNTEFFNMSSFIGYSDMADPANYSIAKGMLDIENFCDYFITETYLLNIDWLGSYTNNIKFWRPNNPPGKWRYVLWDTDLSLGIAESWGGAATTNFLNLTINPPTLNPHSSILKGLLNNTEFKNYFVDRYADLMNTVFQPAKMQESAFKIRDEMLPEMARHFNLWAGPIDLWDGFIIGKSTDVPSWELNIDTMLLFANNRITNARDHIQSEFSLLKQVDVTLNVKPEGAGKIKISTITPETLPWTGVYFDGVPVTISVSPNPGYSFKYWQSEVLVSSPYSNSSMTLNISSNDQFTAYFEKLSDYFEVFPNPFNNQFTIKFELPADKQVSIIIYNILGQKVAEPVSNNTFQEEGIHSITVDANELRLDNGIYFIEFRSKDFKKSIKLVRTRVD